MSNFSQNSSTHQKQPSTSILRNSSSENCRKHPRKTTVAKSNIGRSWKPRTYRNLCSMVNLLPGNLLLPGIVLLKLLRWQSLINIKTALPFNFFLGKYKSLFLLLLLVTYHRGILWPWPTDVIELFCRDIQRL